MKTLFVPGLMWLVVAACLKVGAQTYDTNNVIVQTFAGSGFSGYYDGQGTQTMFNKPLAIVADSSTNLFVLDAGNFRVRKIGPDGTVSTFAGGGTLAVGYGTNVTLGQGVFSTLTTMAIDHSNTLWITGGGGGSYFLWRIGSDGYVWRTNLGGPYLFTGVCVDSMNNVYFSTVEGVGVTAPDNKIFRFRTNAVLEVFAGSGNRGSTDGNGVFTSFFNPSRLASDAADNIYVWDSGNGLIRRINQNRDVVTIAGISGVLAERDGDGTNSSFEAISAMCMDGSGNLILASDGTGSFPYGSSIRKMTASTNVLTLAGSFTQTGYTNGTGSLSRFFGPLGVCVSRGIIFVADSGNHRIRNVTFNPVPQAVPDANLDLNIYAGLQITGVVGRTYRVDSSTDMSVWHTEATILLTYSPFLRIDPSDFGQKKFYRAFLLP